MMDQAKGIANNVAGRAQDAFGGAMGDLGTQAQGKLRQAAGKAQKVYGQALSGLSDNVSNKPLPTLAVIAGLSFVLGAMWSRRS